MDPNAALRELLDAIDAEDADAIEEYAEALQGWVRAGGFLPETVKDCPRLFRHFLDFSADYAYFLRNRDL